MSNWVQKYKGNLETNYTPMSLVQIQMLIKNVVVYNRFPGAACRLVIALRHVTCFTHILKLAKSTKWTAPQKASHFRDHHNGVAPNLSVGVQSNNQSLSRLRYGGNVDKLIDLNTLFGED